MHNEPSPHLDSLQTCCGRYPLSASAAERKLQQRMFWVVYWPKELPELIAIVFVGWSLSTGCFCCCFRLMTKHPLNSSVKCKERRVILSLTIGIKGESQRYTAWLTINVHRDWICARVLLCKRSLSSGNNNQVPKATSCGIS